MRHEAGREKILAAVAQNSHQREAQSSRTERKDKAERNVASSQRSSQRRRVAERSKPHAAHDARHREGAGGMLL